MIIGNQSNANTSIFATGQSIASHLAVQFNNADTDAEIHALIYAAFVLLVITTIINGIARVMIMRVSSRRPTIRPDRPGLLLRLQALVTKA